MFGSSQRTSKLSTLRLTLSKYNAKYLKPSPILDEVSSGEEETNESREKSSERTQAHDPSSTVTHLNVQSVPPGESTVNGTDLSASILDSGHPQVTNNAEGKPSTTDQSDSLVVEENSLLETASSIDSVETDSAFGFNNIHSVSSLAESVLPFDDEKNAPVSAAVHQLNNSPRPSISPSSSLERGRILVSNCEKQSDIIIGRSVEILHSPSLAIAKNDGIKSGESLELKPKTETISFSEKSGKLLFEVGENKGKSRKKHIKRDKNVTSKPLMNTHADSDKDPKFQSSQSKASHVKQAVDYKFNSFQEMAKKSVGVQTSVFSNSSRKLQSNDNRVASKSALGCPGNVLVIKSTKLPKFLTNNFASNDTPIPVERLICSRQQTADALCTTEDEISRLVSYHLQLTKEFLERQHKIYIANCEAVKLLERGYQENFLQSISYRSG